MRRGAARLVLAVLTALLAAPAGSSPGDPQERLNYDTVCQVVGRGIIAGYVTNRSLDTYQVNGHVRFMFFVAGTMSRTGIDQSAEAVILPGRRVEVTQARLLFEVGPDEECRFEVVGKKGPQRLPLMPSLRQFQCQLASFIFDSIHVLVPDLLRGVHRRHTCFLLRILRRKTLRISGDSQADYYQY